jgi:hypothetical protein
MAAMVVNLRLATTDLEFVQISNGQTVPLGLGLQIGKYQSYLYVQS